MSDAEWDADDYEAAAPAVVVTDKWDGEDEDDDLKDNWDEESGDETKDASATSAEPAKKKKTLKEKIAEREAKRIAELEEKKKAEEARQQALSPAEIALEKARQLKIQEDADLELAKEAFGTGDSEPAGVIDSFNPQTQEDFDKYAELLKEKILKSERSPFFYGFLNTLIGDIALNLDTEELKKLGTKVSAMASEKAKQQKASKGKKKKNVGSAKLNSGRDNDYADHTVGAYDDFDDFI